MSHTDYQDLLSAYALDAIDPDDGQALAEHLATCEECRGELIALREAGNLLAHASPAAVPGDHVRAQLLKQVRAEAVRSQPAHVVQMPQRSKTVWPNLRRLAAAIAFVALLAGVILFWRREVRLTVEMARQHEALSLLSSPETAKIQLTGMPAAPNSRATFAFDKRTGRAVLMTEGLPVTAADKAYEVWFIPKGRAPMPGRVFTVDSSGHAMIMERMPPEAMDGAVIAITVEPKGGSASPTGAIHLASPAS